MAQPDPLVDDALAEDDAPIVGADLEVPPIDDGEDAHRAPEQALGHMHNPPPVPSPVPPTEPPQALSDVLVLFDEEPGGQPLPDPVVHVDDNPPGFDASSGLRAGTPEPARLRSMSPRPAPGLADDEWFRDEDGDPPTEEAHPSTIEDFEGLYRAPMNVPEPPPIPGILDRFTPAPTSPVGDRAAGVGAQGATRPEFVPEPPRGVTPPGVPKPRGVWDETPLPSDGRPKEVSEVSGVAGRSPPSREKQAVWQDPLFLAIIIGAFLFAVVVLLGLAFLIGPRGGPVQPPAEPASIAPLAPLPLIQRPEADLAPALPSAGDDPQGDADPATQDSDAPAEPGQAGGAAEPAEAAPAAAPAPAPEPAPRPTARVASPKADAPGKLIIRATRATLVYVNGQPVGMSPAEVERPAGVYTVHISDKGKRIEKRVDLDAGATRTVDF